MEAACPASVAAVPSLDELDANPALAETLPASAIKTLARRAARLAGDLQVLLIGRAAEAILATPRQGPDRLIAVPEAARRMDVTPAHLYDLIRQGRFPSVPVGNKYVRVRASDVDAFIEPGQISGIDGRVGQRHSAGRERPRPTTPSPTRGPDPGQTRRAARPHLQPRRPAGAQRTADHEVDGAACPPDLGIDEGQAEE